jgi:hypothetical protein
MSTKQAATYTPPNADYAGYAAEYLAHLDADQIAEILLSLLSHHDCEKVADRLGRSPYVPPPVTESIPRQETVDRLRAWTNALNHWTRVGYSFPTARALASVLHGRDDDVRHWAISIMQTQTNLRLEDML